MPLLSGEWPFTLDGFGQKCIDPKLPIKVKVVQRNLDLPGQAGDILRTLKSNAVHYHVIAEDATTGRELCNYGLGTDAFIKSFFSSQEGRVFSESSMSKYDSVPVAEYEMTYEDFQSAKDEMDRWMNSSQTKYKLHPFSNSEQSLGGVDAEELKMSMEQFAINCQAYAERQHRFFTNKPSVKIKRDFSFPSRGNGIGEFIEPAINAICNQIDKWEKVVVGTLVNVTESLFDSIFGDFDLGQFICHFFEWFLKLLSNLFCCML